MNCIDVGLTFGVEDNVGCTVNDLASDVTDNVVGAADFCITCDIDNNSGCTDVDLSSGVKVTCNCCSEFWFTSGDKENVGCTSVGLASNVKDTDVGSTDVTLASGIDSNFIVCSNFGIDSDVMNNCVCRTDLDAASDCGKGFSVFKKCILVCSNAICTSCFEDAKVGCTDASLFCDITDNSNLAATDSRVDSCDKETFDDCSDFSNKDGFMCCSDVKVFCSDIDGLGLYNNNFVVCLFVKLFIVSMDASGNCSVAGHVLATIEIGILSEIEYKLGE